MGARLGFGQPLGQTLQQQAQGRQIGGCATSQQPLYLTMLDGKDAPPFGLIQLGELIGDAGRVIVKSGVWGQAAFLSDSSWTCTPSLNFTLFTTNVSSANPLSRFHFF